MFPEHYLGHVMNDLYDRLERQIKIAYLYMGEEQADERAAEVTGSFLCFVCNEKTAVSLTQQQDCIKAV